MTAIPDGWQHALDDLWGCIGKREMEHLQPETVRLAKENGGQVSANDVRPLLPPWVLPQRVGAVFVAMKSAGELERVGKVPSDDSEGRNTHHDHGLWRLRAGAA